MAGQQELRSPLQIGPGYRCQSYSPNWIGVDNFEKEHLSWDFLNFRGKVEIFQNLQIFSENYEENWWHEKSLDCWVLFQIGPPLVLQDHARFENLRKADYFRSPRLDRENSKIGFLQTISVRKSPKSNRGIIVHLRFEFLTSTNFRFSSFPRAVWMRSSTSRNFRTEGALSLLHDSRFSCSLPCP